MNNFSEIEPSQVTENPFTLLSKDWTLITAGNKTTGYNTMTASWGGVGVLWNKNVATIYVRPQRYTYEFIEKNELFTLSFFHEKYRDALTYCGRNSGRDGDKASASGLTAIDCGGSVAFEEAKLILVCKKLYYADIDPNNFCVAGLEAHYQNDYHRAYIGEIVNIFRAK